MRILLLHADDDPLSGPWNGQQWDEVLDLARSGWAACGRWSKAFGCPVKPIDALRVGSGQIRRVRELLQSGLGRLVDQEDLDWWELTALLVHQQIERLVLLKEFAGNVPAGSEVFVTRDGFEARALHLLLGERLHVIFRVAQGRYKGLRHYAERIWRLPNAEILQILGDKYDTDYKVRRHIHRHPRRSERPVVLVPSSYINMSLTGTAYARLVPDAHFLLVATRRSGRLPDVPDNVRQAWLASYAGDAGANELRTVLQRWTSLKKEMEQVPELAALIQLGLVEDFPRRFADGLAIRNAWRRVFETESVEAVLCCDDSNPHTHIPLLLAHRRGLPTVACHHGALDGRLLIKKNHADVILAKGRMEQDYLVNVCGIAAPVVEIGAPGARENIGSKETAGGDWIVFFSEPYEMTGGRTAEIYRDILPNLADLAKRTGKILVVKLHPSENLPDRQSIARGVLTREQMAAVQWLAGRIDEALLRRTWFGLTVLSSVAMECMIQGVPCFFCDWLDLWPYGYLDQYRKFGVSRGLSSPEEIGKVPELVTMFRPNDEAVKDCWQPMTSRRLKQLLAAPISAQGEPLETQRA